MLPVYLKRFFCSCWLSSVCTIRIRFFGYSISLLTFFACFHHYRLVSEICSNLLLWWCIYLFCCHYAFYILNLKIDAHKLKLTLSSELSHLWLCSSLFISSNFFCPYSLFCVILLESYFVSVRIALFIILLANFFEIFLIPKL